MIVGDTANTSGDWSVEPILTVGEINPAGESINAIHLGYEIPGVPDGLGAFQVDENTVRVLINHELGNTAGNAYELSNGTELTGARISYVDIDRNTRRPTKGGLAVDTIYNRAGDDVDSPDDLDYAGLNRLCSGTFYPPNQFGPGLGFADPIYLTSEEQSSASGPPGGTYWVLDPVNGELWAAPDLGRGSWENATILDTGRTDTVALLLGDDHGAASGSSAPEDSDPDNPSPPLYMYVGVKDSSGNFIERNGLVGGSLFVWQADDSSVNDPSDFNGTGSSESGHWVDITSYNTGTPGSDYTDDGYATDATLRRAAVAEGAFQFSRPEDLATNPRNGTEAVMASTGRSNILGDADVWGTVYVIETDFEFIGPGALDTAGTETTLTILYDGDDADHQREGVRSPDNVDWADNGSIFVQEDDSVGFATYEASIWQLDPGTPGDATRILEMDRSAVPLGQNDNHHGLAGAWESSGVLDVTSLFKTESGETLLILDVQAHSLNDGLVGDAGLVEGGQLLFATNS